MSAAECLAKVISQIEAAALKCHRPPPRLVAVSKTKPIEAVLDVYSAGHRHFGENYVQELIEKAPACPADIKWHFIGQLQSNKAKPLVTGVPNLWVVESVDSEKLAGKLQSAAAAVGRGSGSNPRLKVMLQVNTSEEPQKGGVENEEEATALARYILDQCPALELSGLMTIGKLGEVASSFFERLVAVRAAVASSLSLDPSSLELSMGMSGDFDLAIAHGSSNVRVGSAIFGEREYKTSRPRTVSGSASGIAEATTPAGAADEANESRNAGSHPGATGNSGEEPAR